jgi:hypothetical protein
VAAGTLAALVVLAVALAFAVDEPLRRAIERKINERLRGYTVAIARLDFHPLGFSLDLEGITVTQDGRPEPPVAQIGLITASVQWRALRRGRLVANFSIDRPIVHVDRTNVLGEVDDNVPLRERGWQAAVEAFMESGATAATGTFRPAGSPDFDVKLEIEDTDLTRLNDLLRAYAKVDVTQGLFTFYAEARVQNGAVQGYAKPLFRDVEVYHPGQDAAKHLVRQLYALVVGGVARLLENKTPRKEVATRTEFKGPLGGDVKAGTLEAVVGLVQNAFFKAILPGFEGYLGRRPSDGDRRP